MVPFSNRLQNGRLYLGETEVLFPQNWPKEGNAIHGTGCEDNWKILEQESNKIEMSHNWNSAEDFYSFEAI